MRLKNQNILCVAHYRGGVVYRVSIGKRGREWKYPELARFSTQDVVNGGQVQGRRPWTTLVALATQYEQQLTDYSVIYPICIPSWFR